MSDNVKFPFSVSRRAFARKPRASRNGTPEERAALQETLVEEESPGLSKNQRLRKERREAWREADIARYYWERRLRFEDAVACVQRWGMPEGRLHPTVKSEDHMPLVKKYRAAKVRQLLTPAPDAAAVKWKQVVLADENKYNFVGIKPERIERAIADDLAFLAAHPVHQSNRRKQR